MYYPFFPEASITDNYVYLVTGLFKSTSDIEKVLKKLEQKGYGKDDISLIMTDETHRRDFAIEQHNRADEAGFGMGSAGGVAGAIISGLMSAGILPSGGLNLVAAGPVISTLAGFGAGAIAGGLFGAMVGAGIPEYEIDFYKDRVKNGNVLMAVQTSGPKEADKVEAIFAENNVIMKNEKWKAKDPQQASQTR